MQRSPDYILKAMDKLSPKKKGRVGAGWIEEDGSISIIIDRFAVLLGADNITVKLFPNDFKEDKDA